MSVSVITPMYNEAVNIQSCYRSLCSQKNIKFEWVIIDDGSTDNSVEIVKAIIKLHSADNFTISLIEQQNAGAASARKKGLQNCNYDIITILDADDRLSEHALEFAFAKISNSVDIVCFQIKFVDMNGCLLSNFNYQPTEWPIKGQKAFAKCIDDWGLTGLFLIKKTTLTKAYDYISNLYLANSINSDELISRLAMFFAEDVDICDGVYFYYKNPNSTTNRINERYYNVIFTAIALDKFIKLQNNLEWQVKSQLHMLATIWGVSSKYYKWRPQLKNRHEWLVSLNLLSKQIDFALLLKSKLSFKRKIKVYLKLILAFFMSLYTKG